MNIGIIGTGNMGSMLTHAFITSKAVKPSELFVTNRSIHKANDLKKISPEIHVLDTAKEIVKHCELVIVCIKPHEIHQLLTSLQTDFKPDQCLVSITSPVTVSQIESIVPCHVARIIPSITNLALHGVTLVSFGNHCSTEWQEKLINLFSHISKPTLISDEVTRISSDITSCGPAFFSFLLQKFINAAVEETSISTEQATLLAEEMIVGFGKLIEQKHFSLKTLQEKVCVKGGITGEGIKALESNIGDLFEKMIKKTHKKFGEEVNKISDQF
ncbi:late competence protein ComER [Bacillus sp. RG28]|uniref:Pyrroline-5-carboxylate reductase n=1 Tax=Gottfriedia endophytica TaxID=2820819 RepID=A0A940NLL0_9BACI|nr:late competence protein ComER [Gottfriedia endophytica]MBP0723750.1 late competence protein ComER [Gottfriedia endophytica]